MTDHGIDAKTGCAILFIYYLHTQLGYGIKDIIAAAAPELSGVYKNLTGDPSDPFPSFKNFLDTYFPGTTAIPGSNPDNPFPLGPYRRLPERIGDLDGDGQDEIVVSSPWGMGFLKLAGGTLTSAWMAPNGTAIGSWTLNTATNQFGPAGDFDGDRAAELFVSDSHGVGLLKLAANTMNAPMVQPNGTRFGGWLLNTADNTL